MLLISSLLITSITGYVQNEVHEWGVVVFEENTGLVCGETWHDFNFHPDYIVDDMCAEAPVVWIYGEPFEKATFTVLTGEQSITLTYPSPDRMTQGSAEWDISSSLPIEVVEETRVLIEDEESMETYAGPFWWAVDSWREVQSLSLYQEHTGASENFLYYECTVDSDFTDNFFRWSPNGNPVFSRDRIEEALLFSPEGVFTISVPMGELIPFIMPIKSGLNANLIQDTFSAWGKSNLEPAEIDALWETWAPVFTEEGSYWLVFPIPAQYYNSISTISISFENSDPRLVVYSRLFLGAIRLNL